MKKHIPLVAFAALCCWCFGCVAQSRVDLLRRTGGSAFLFQQFQAYDGTTGRPLRFADIPRRCRNADVVLFGEQHGNPVCNQLEAQLLYALLGTRRPLTLAMEFFEADTQAALDAYLTGRINETEFLQQTRQRSSYLNSHRPLIELSRAAGVPVLAANAPRRLVTAYRNSGVPYPGYRAELDAEERRWLPVSCEPLAGPYRERFAAAMRMHTPTTRPASQPSSQPSSQPATQTATQPSTQPVTRPAAEEPPATMPTRPTWLDFYKAQLLWDDAMAESIANFRERFPRWRVLLIVGAFHVAHDGGTAIKLRQRCPDDRLFTIVYRDNPDGDFSFRQEDRGSGDIVIYGLSAPKPKPKKTMPKLRPEAETQPAESQPASAPTTASAPATTSAPTPGAVPRPRP